MKTCCPTTNLKRSKGSDGFLRPSLFSICQLCGSGAFSSPLLFYISLSPLHRFILCTLKRWDRLEILDHCDCSVSHISSFIQHLASKTNLSLEGTSKLSGGLGSSWDDRSQVTRRAISCNGLVATETVGWHGNDWMQRNRLSISRATAIFFDLVGGLILATPRNL